MMAKKYITIRQQECSQSEYSIAWSPGLRIDIPEDLRGSYCATLGHKVS